MLIKRQATNLRTFVDSTWTKRLTGMECCISIYPVFLLLTCSSLFTECLWYGKSLRYDRWSWEGMATADGNGGRREKTHNKFPSIYLLLLQLVIAKHFVEDLVSINWFFGLSIDSFLMLCWCLVLVSVCLFCVFESEWNKLGCNSNVAWLTCHCGLCFHVRYSTSPPAGTSPCSFWLPVCWVLANPHCRFIASSSPSKRLNEFAGEESQDCAAIECLGTSAVRQAAAWCDKGLAGLAKNVAELRWQVLNLVDLSGRLKAYARSLERIHCWLHSVHQIPYKKSWTW